MELGDLHRQMKEIDILKRYQHDNMIHLNDFFENNDYFFIVLEMMAGGDLFDYMERRNFDISED
jgi:serine/threonine protein kinase